MLTAALIDLDGTLLDSNYHHSFCWYQAFAEHGLILPLWQLHRKGGRGRP
jgi:beta-phosphoglucomutase-like phosphatase (HAD superfamily)